MFKRFVLTFSLLFFSNVSIGAVLDFEEFSPPVNSILNFSTPIQSNGFQFSPTPAAIPVNTRIQIAHDSQSNVPNSGSNTLLAGAASGGFTVTELGGASFDLGNFWGAEGRNTTTGFFQYSATGIVLDGTRSDGTTVTQTLNFDLVATENLGDFELFSPVGFTNLTMLTLTGFGGGEFGGNAFAIDDINLTALSAVPIPAAIWLFGTALVGFIGFSRRRNVA